MPTLEKHTAPHMLEKDTIITVAEDLTAADLDGEAIILNIKTGHYFGLNELGARVFELIQRPVSMNVVMDALLEEYDVEREQLEHDVLIFLEDLRRHQLISVHNEMAV